MRTKATLKMDCRGGLVCRPYMVQMYFADFGDSVIVELFAWRGNFMPH